MLRFGAILTVDTYTDAGVRLSTFGPRKGPIHNGLAVLQIAKAVAPPQRDGDPLKEKGRSFQTEQALLLKAP